MTDQELGEAVRFVGVQHAQGMLRQVMTRSIRFASMSIKIEVTLPEGGGGAFLTLSRSGKARRFWTQGHGDGKAVAAIRNWVNYGQVPVGYLEVSITPTLPNGQGSYVYIYRSFEGKKSVSYNGDAVAIAAIQRWLGI